MYCVIERTKQLNDSFFVEPRRGATLQIPHYQYRFYLLFGRRFIHVFCILSSILIFFQ
jgi:hypothetical protein